MKPMSNFEKKFGKYAIKNISLVLILFYACGYLINWINPVMFNYLTLNPYAILFKGQVWRLITWLIIPPENFSFFTLIMLYFYYSIGTTLERTWGTYRYNLYLFLGIIFTAVGAFAMMGFVYLFQRDILFAMGAENYFAVLSTMFSTYYVNMSILAFAATFPDMQVLLFFFIPIKVKILGIIYGVLLVYEFIAGVGNKYLNAANRFVIGASLLNFIVFFLTSRNMIHMSPKQVKRRQEFKREVKQSAKITRHKCAICGRTEETNPELEFRFCSKCDGNYEYCQDHLFTHAHVKYQGDHK